MALQLSRSQKPVTSRRTEVKQNDEVTFVNNIVNGEQYPNGTTWTVSAISRSEDRKEDECVLFNDTSLLSDHLQDLCVKKFEIRRIMPFFDDTTKQKKLQDAIKNVAKSDTNKNKPINKKRIHINKFKKHVR